MNENLTAQQAPEQVQKSETPTSGRRTRINFVVAKAETAESPSLTLREFKQAGQALYDGLQFKITGACELQVTKDGSTAPKADAKRHPVFTTTVDGAYRFASAYLKPKADIRNKPLVPRGSFDDVVRQVLDEPANIDRKLVDILSDIASQYADRTLVVRRTPYRAVNSSGDAYDATLVNIDFVD